MGTLHDGSALADATPRPGPTGGALRGVLAVACWFAVYAVSSVGLIVFNVVAVMSDIGLRLTTTWVPDVVASVWIGLTMGAATWAAAVIVRRQARGSGRWLLVIPLGMSAVLLLGARMPGVPLWVDAITASIGTASSVWAVSRPRRR